MSSKPHQTQGTEKPSRYKRDTATEAVGFNYCPHCGAELSATLAQHMGHGACGEHTSRNEETPPPQPEVDKYDEPPTLDNHAERDHPDDDLDERRQLADELADAGVWV